MRGGGRRKFVIIKPTGNPKNKWENNIKGTKEAG
jgi:hypothetical protein